MSLTWFTIVVAMIVLDDDVPHPLFSPPLSPERSFRRTCLGGSQREGRRAAWGGGWGLAPVSRFARVSVRRSCFFRCVRRCVAEFLLLHFIDVRLVLGVGRGLTLTVPHFHCKYSQTLARYAHVAQFKVYLKLCFRTEYIPLARIILLV